MKINCQEIRDRLLAEAAHKIQDQDLSLIVFQVGEDDASSVYVRNKKKTCESIGINFIHRKLPIDATFAEAAGAIDFAVKVSRPTGIMLQLPLPPQLQEHEQELLDLIPWYMDVDGLSTNSVGRLWNDMPCLKPCTAQGVMEVLPKDLRMQRVLLLGRSKLIGKPLVKMILDRHGTPTVAHSKSDYALPSYHIIVSAIGQANKFHWYDLDDRQLFIDVSINRDERGKLCGDLDARAISGPYTPVPGGIGLLTTAFVALNTIKAKELQDELCSGKK